MGVWAITELAGKVEGAGLEALGGDLIISPAQGHASLPNPCCGQATMAWESSWLECSWLGHAGGEHS